MFRFDKKILYIIAGIILLQIVVNSISNPNTAISALLTVPAVLIAITFHEFGHAYAAYKLGDDTAQKQGRLNLNPLSHIDPLGMVMLFSLGIGWGKPVQINPRNFNRDISMTKAEAIVSIAGPAMNFLLAIVFAFVYGLCIKYNWLGALDIQVQIYIILAIYYTIMLNIGLGIFNLIPLPPLDGSKILKHFLPSKARFWFEANEQIFYIVFIIIWVFGIAGTIISPIIGGISDALMSLVKTILGI